MLRAQPRPNDVQHLGIFPAAKLYRALTLILIELIVIRYYE